jgi:hypothetical protein
MRLYFLIVLMDDKKLLIMSPAFGAGTILFDLPLGPFPGIYPPGKSLRT